MGVMISVNHLKTDPLTGAQLSYKNLGDMLLSIPDLEHGDTIVIRAVVNKEGNERDKSMDVRLPRR